MGASGSTVTTLPYKDENVKDQDTPFGNDTKHVKVDVLSVEHFEEKSFSGDLISRFNGNAA